MPVTKELMSLFGFCAGSRSVFRLPPPIPGKPGGGYATEWHDAQTTIKRSYIAHRERKRARGPAMHEVGVALTL